MAKIKDKELLDIIYNCTHIKNEDGEDIPYFCFISDIIDELDLKDEDVIKLSLDNGYLALKVFPGETMRGGLIICAEGCSKESVDKMYEDFFGEVPEMVEINIVDGEIIEKEPVSEAVLSSDVADLLIDEKEASEGYLEVISNNPELTPEEKETLLHINSEELEHIEELSDLLKKDEPEEVSLEEKKNTKKRGIVARDPNAQAMWGRTRSQTFKSKKGKGSFTRKAKHKSLTEDPDIFGIETNAEIEADADARRKEASKKRRQIIDGDMLTYAHNYEMLDRMACEPTLAKKKEYIINYLMREVALDRRPDAISSGGFNVRFAAEKEYIGKPVDREMAAKMADYILDLYKNTDGVKYIRQNLGGNSFVYKDKNGVNVTSAGFENQDLLNEYRYKVALDMFPASAYPNFYFSTKYSDRKTEGTPRDFIYSSLSSEQQNKLDKEADKLRKEDPRYIKLEPLTESADDVDVVYSSATSEDIEKFKKILTGNGYTIDSVSEYSGWSTLTDELNYYIQITSVSNTFDTQSFEEEFEKMSDLFDEFETETGVSVTYSFGLTRDGHSTAGIDLREKKISVDYSTLALTEDVRESESINEFAERIKKITKQSNVKIIK